MDEISQEPERNFRLPPNPRRWLTAVAIAGVVAAGAVVAVNRGGGRPIGVASSPAATGSLSQSVSSGVVTPNEAISEITPSPPLHTPRIVRRPAAAPGTVLMTCDMTVAGALDPDWRATSLRVGTLWLVGGRQIGFVRLGRAPHAGRTPTSGSEPSAPGQMLVHVDAGSAVVMRPAAGSRSYFQFWDDPSGGSYHLLGNKGFTFVPCPGGPLPPDAPTDFYNVGYAIAPGHTASVEVWTSASARPVWLTFAEQ
jgi:hypothetical protein